MQQPSDMPEILRDTPAEPDGLALPDGQRAAAGPPSRAIWRRLPWLLLLLVVAVSLVMWLARRPVPVLTRQTLAEAQARWRQAGPAGYEFRLEIRAPGLAPAVVHAVVQDRKLVQLAVDGEPASSGDPSMYTVEGLLQVLEQELAIQETGLKAGSQDIRPVLRVRFDRSTGMPLMFLRMVPGTNRSTTWQVVEWRPRPAGTAPTSAGRAASASAPES